MVGIAAGLIFEKKSDTEWSVLRPDTYDRMTLLRNDYTLRPSREVLRTMMGAVGGILRRAMLLLSVINDVPIGAKHVTQTRGFVAQGRYRRFLDHTIVTINLPKGRDPHKVARSIIAVARRRAHEVRGHWRRDWRHEGQRIWIREHQRGDASLGFVTHDYKVEHDTETT